MRNAFDRSYRDRNYYISILIGSIEKDHPKQKFYSKGLV